MKERPIIFSADMVRAILEGRKTQTRRPVKLRTCEARTKCPYGEPGDRLWVRETWYESGSWQRSWPEDDEWSLWFPRGRDHIFYAADGEPTTRGANYWNVPVGTTGGKLLPDSGGYLWRKRPSIYMPRWASRLLLEIMDVRVELLHSITPADALAEGVSGINAIDYFADIWDYIHADDGLGWSTNPLVWAITFSVLPNEEMG